MEKTEQEYLSKLEEIFKADPTFKPVAEQLLKDGHTAKEIYEAAMSY